MSLDPLLDPPDLPERFGRYRVLRRLGRGGMGTVYLAHDTELDRRVALKVPRFGPDDAAGRQRFQREARSAAALAHPNVCPVYDVGEIDGVPFLSMAFVEGRSLAEVLGRGPLPPRRAALLARKLALAVAAAHDKGIVHRDLKPANVMLDADGEPVITDFGLARRLDSGDARLTHEGAVLGTPAYMAPEQVSGDVAAHGPLTDVYSLGALLYEMLTGRLPFAGLASEVLVRVATVEPRRPSDLRGEIDADLEAIVLKAMAKEPAERFPSMRALATALGDYLKLPAAAETDVGPPVPTRTGDEPVFPAGRRTMRRAAHAEDRSTLLEEPPGRRRGRRAWLWLGVGAAALTVLAGVGIGVWALTRPQEKPAPPEPGAPGPSLPPGWVRFAPPGGGFSVALPGAPTRSQNTFKVGEAQAVQQVYSIVEGDRRYVAAHVDLPVASVEDDQDRWVAALNNAALGSLGNGTLFEQKRITLRGRQAVEFTYHGELEGRPVRMVWRSYFVRNRIISLIAVLPRAAYSREALQPFFDSFQIGP
jgi:predicted Ser/Thr protein kinase